LLGGNLPGNYPVIDRFKDGIATSIKSMDLASRTYGDPRTITRIGRGYIDKVAQFKPRPWGKVTIQGSQIEGRALGLAIPRGATEEQCKALNGLVEYGRSKGVSVNVKVIE
jgi:filamentous hemagglutinin